MKAILAVCAFLAVVLVALVTLTPPRGSLPAPSVAHPQPAPVHVIVECPVSMPRDDCQVILDAALAEAKRMREARRQP